MNHPPMPGLRPMVNKSNTAVRLEVIVAAGDEMHVSADVAAQLPAAFADPTVAPPSAEEAEVPAETPPEPEAEDAPAPKRARKAKD